VKFECLLWGSGTADGLWGKESFANRPAGHGSSEWYEGVAVDRGCVLRTTGDCGSCRSACRPRMTGSSL